MTSINMNKLGTPWEETKTQQLSRPADALSYLRFISEEEPGMLLDCLKDVLKSCPQVTGVAIPLYAHRMNESDLNELANTFGGAERYINEYRAALTPLLSA